MPMHLPTLIRLITQTFNETGQLFLHRWAGQAYLRGQTPVRLPEDPLPRVGQEDGITDHANGAIESMNDGRALSPEKLDLQSPTTEKPGQCPGFSGITAAPLPQQPIHAGAPLAVGWHV